MKKKKEVPKVKIKRDKNKLEMIKAQRNLIEKYSFKLPLNELFIGQINNPKKIKSNSWFDIKNIENENKIKNKISVRETDYGKDKKPKKIIKCRKIKLKPTKEQEKKLIIWFEACRQMFNETTKKYNADKYNVPFKKYMLNKTVKLTTNFQTMRTTHMKEIKNKIRKDFKNEVPSHVLDDAIKMSTVSNAICRKLYSLGHIKFFRIRYIKKNKTSNVICIQKNDFKKDGFYTLFLGKKMDYSKKDNENFKFTDIKKDCKIHWNKITNTFMLLVPIEEKCEEKKDKVNFIGIDPGIRTFLTGLSNKGVVEIGTNLTKEISKDFMRLDKIEKNEKIKKKIKKRYRNILNERIKNKITDLHWKSINYLVKNFDGIVIGKWSTKQIINKKTSVLNRMTKKIANNLSFYKFLLKLQYKCTRNDVDLQIVKEHYTSKMCSNCGWLNENLGGSKKFNCQKCELYMDRDINSTRNILMKGIN